MKNNISEIRNFINKVTKLNESTLNGSTILINEDSLNKILGYHYNNGFIIITSYRGGEEKSDEENKNDFKELKNIVRQNGFSFIPVYGGYIENVGTEQQREVREPALLVPNQQVATTNQYDDDKKLYNLGLQLANKYNQDEFLYKPKGENNEAYYVNKQGNKTMTFTNKSINDLSQIYFTDLEKGFNKPKDKSFDKTTKRFTFTENVYINKSPKGLSEAWSRYGENFINLK